MKNIKGIIIVLMMVYLTINIGVNSAGNEADVKSEKKEDVNSEKKEDVNSEKKEDENSDDEEEEDDDSEEEEADKDEEKKKEAENVEEEQEEEIIVGKIMPDKQFEDLMKHCRKSLRDLKLKGKYTKDREMLTNRSSGLPVNDFLPTYDVFINFLFYRTDARMKSDTPDLRFFYCKYVYTLLSVGYTGLFVNDKNYNPYMLYDVTDPALRKELDDYAGYLKPMEKPEHSGNLIYFYFYASTKLYELLAINEKNIAEKKDVISIL